MTNIREFIKKLGDKAPAFFDTKASTVERWLKTGSIPMKAVEKVLISIETIDAIRAPQASVEQPQVDPVTHLPAQAEPTEPQVDPITHLPIGIDTRRPQLQGTPPSVIEMSPTEQSWGINLTRPGRINRAPLPPMKIRKVDGMDVPYVEQPKPVTTLPPEIGGGEAGWSNPLPVKDEPSVKKEQAKSLPTEKVS